MKVTIDIDCSAAEAREMLGLPDIAKLQQDWLKQVEARMMEEVANFSPENIMKSWAAGASSNADWLPNLFAAFAQADGDKKQCRSRTHRKGASAA